MPEPAGRRLNLARISDGRRLAADHADSAYLLVKDDQVSGAVETERHRLRQFGSGGGPP
jgi:hypothetical protein